MEIRTLGLLASLACLGEEKGAHAEKKAHVRKTYDFALSISFEVGYVAMSRFEEGLQDFAADIKMSNPEARVRGTPGGNLLMGMSPRFRLYLPHNTFAEMGVGYLRNTGSLDLEFGDVPAVFSYSNTSVEVPVLFGAHLADFDNAHLYGALGPSLLVHNRSNWSYDKGSVSDFGSSGGGGIEFLVGGDLYVYDRMSMNLTIRYRFLRSSVLARQGERFPPVPDPGELDYSGLSIALGTRWHSF